MTFKNQRRLHGFTLLELLVVIAIMAVMIGGVGLYRMHEHVGGRLDAGVRMLGSVASRARLQALVSGNPTRLMVDNEVGSRGRLATLSIVEWRSEVWVPVGQAVDLPRGVRVVPGERSLLAPDWGTELSVFSGAGQRFSFDPDGRGRRDFLYVDFLPNGMPDALGESDYLVDDLAMASVLPVVYLSEALQVDAGLLSFEHPELLAGVSISLRGDVRIIAEK